MTYQKERDIAQKQVALDAAIEALPGILRVDNHLDALMDWLRGVVDSANRIGVRWNPDTVANVLEGAGYKENEFAGHKPDWFNTRERMGRYVVGQAINCMRHEMPPHPIAFKFIDEYFALDSPTNRER